MAATLKAELVQLMKRLHRDMPPSVRSKLGHIIAKLERNDTLIPDKAGKQEVSYFLYLVMQENPELMTPVNRELFNQFTVDAGLDDKPRPSSGRRK